MIKYEFIHIPRTGGTSMEHNLMNAYGHKKATSVELKGKFSFSFVRNPYDRLVSVYFFNCAKRNRDPNNFISFRNWVRTIRNNDAENLERNKGLLPLHYWLCDTNKKILVDFVGRFENIDEDWKYVANKIGCNDRLHKLNSTTHQHYEDYYDTETENIVKRLYSQDFNIFNYEK